VGNETARHRAGPPADVPSGLPGRNLRGGSPIPLLAVAAAAAVAVLSVVAVVAFSGGPANHPKAGPHSPTVLLAGDAPRVSVSPKPAIDAAAKDKVDDGPCQTPIPDSTPRPCVTGETAHPTLRVALVGDSVAGQWRRDLEVVAASQHWMLIVDLHGECPWTATLTAKLHGDAPYPSCQDWGAATLQDMLTKYKPDVIITSARPVLGTPSHPAPDPTSFGQIADGMVTYWQQLIDAGTRIVAIQETPEPGRNVPDCLARPGATPPECASPTKTADTPHSPLEQAVHKIADDRAELVDMNDLICGPLLCRPIIDYDILVYRDTHHLTLTYSLSLLPDLRRRLLATTALGG
jgi:hypothetical protein